MMVESLLVALTLVLVVPPPSLGSRCRRTPSRHVTDGHRASPPPSAGIR
uniref:Uncharacterized protein n=1 Tax=Oryza glumipatula TaxID=40148 RepID=A0A0D9ZWF6_9ORYZ